MSRVHPIGCCREVRRESGTSTHEEVELGAESDATILLR